MLLDTRTSEYDTSAQVELDALRVELQLVYKIAMRTKNKNPWCLAPEVDGEVLKGVVDRVGGEVWEFVEKRSCTGIIQVADCWHGVPKSSIFFLSAMRALATGRGHLEKLETSSTGDVADPSKLPPANGWAGAAAAAWVPWLVKHGMTKSGNGNGEEERIALAKEFLVGQWVIYIGAKARNNAEAHQTQKGLTVAVQQTSDALSEESRARKRFEATTNDRLDKLEASERKRKRDSDVSAPTPPAKPIALKDMVAKPSGEAASSGPFTPDSPLFAENTPPKNTLENGKAPQTQVKSTIAVPSKTKPPTAAAPSKAKPPTVDTNKAPQKNAAPPADATTTDRASSPH
jgi:hypothetical protein